MSTSKIKALSELSELLADHRSRGQRIALANGCFDLLHVGHIRYLSEAKGLCDILAVAINSDSSARALKGENHPVVPALERAEILASLSVVDYVTVFEELDVRGVLQLLKPHLHAKGTDYTRETVPERDQVQALGGQVVITGDPKSHSSRDLIQDIVSRFGRRPMD